MSVLDPVLAAVARQHGERADITAIAACEPELLAAYASKQRVKVRNEATGDVRTGIVSRSLGWQPVLLLVHRVNMDGSSDTLGTDDRVIGWWDGRHYIDHPCDKARSKHVR